LVDVKYIVMDAMKQNSNKRKLKGRGLYPKSHMREIGVNGGKARTRKKLKAVNQNLALAMAARFPDSPKWNPDGMYDALLARRQGQSLDTYKRRRAAKRKMVAATATAGATI
jgi:hypothetical protein